MVWFLARRLPPQARAIGIAALVVLSLLPIYFLDCMDGQGLTRCSLPMDRPRRIDRGATVRRPRLVAAAGKREDRSPHSGSRCTVSIEKAGTQTAMYLAPPSSPGWMRGPSPRELVFMGYVDDVRT